MSDDLRLPWRKAPLSGPYGPLIHPDNGTVSQDMVLRLAAAVPIVLEACDALEAALANRTPLAFTDQQIEASAKEKRRGDAAIAKIRAALAGA